MIELLVDKVVDVDELQNAIGKAFGSKATDVAVVHSVEELAETGKAPVSCERYLLGGEFPMHLTIYVHDRQLASQDERLIAYTLAQVLSARCLISDDENNPYTMILVTPTTSKPVALDIAKLDEEEEYWLV